MSLRDQLAELLPTILPSDPKESIKGTELIRLMRLNLNGAYSDASLRYHFSIMSCDPTSPIAKIEKGQGYYKRTASIPMTSSASDIVSLTQTRLDEFETEQEAVNSAIMRVKKFRAIVFRYFEVQGRFPYVFRRVFDGEGQQAMSNLWKFPELAMVDWSAGEGSGEEMNLDDSLLVLQNQLALPPFSLTSARLRILPTLANHREEFFQALSASSWAQRGELIYAAPIEDEALGDSLRQLSAQHGIGVTTFGLTPEMLDELPRPANILNAHPSETEALMSRIDVTHISPARQRQHLNWQELNHLRLESLEMRKLLDWVAGCIQNKRAVPYQEEA